MNISIKDIYEKIGIFIEKRTLLILLIAFLLIFVSFYGAGKISTETGEDTFVEESSKLYQDYDYLYKQNFGAEAIIVLVESDDISDPEVLKAMDRLGTSMEGKKYVKSTFSIATIIKDFASQQYGHSDIPEDKHTIQQIISHTPEEYLALLMPDDRHAIVMIEMRGDVTTENTEWVLSETKTAVTWANFPPGTSTIVTGEPAFMIAIQEEMNKSMGVMLAISGLLMAVALLIAFRHVRWKLLPLPIVLIGIIYTFGAMGFTNVPMTMVSMAVFPILIGLGVDYAIQFHNRAEEELARGENASEAIIETIKHMGPAVGTAIVATSLGFVALFTSPVPMIRDFGKMSLIGVILSYFVSMFVLLPMLYLLDSRAEKKALKKAHRNGGNSKSTIKAEKITKNGSTEGFGRFLGHFTVTMAKNPLIVIGIASLLTIVGLYADEHVGIQTNIQNFIPQDIKPLNDFDKLNNLIGGSDQLNIIIKSDDVTDPSVIHWMDSFGRSEVEKQKDIISSDSLATPIKVAYGTIPSDPAVVNSIVDGLPGTIKDRYVLGGDLGILNLKIDQNLKTEQIAALIENVKSDIEWYPPPIGVSTTVTGRQVTMTSVLDALTSGRTAMGCLGLTLIFFGLLVIYSLLSAHLKTVIIVFKLNQFPVVGLHRVISLLQ